MPETAAAYSRRGEECGLRAACPTAGAIIRHDCALSSNLVIARVRTVGLRRTRTGTRMDAPGQPETALSLDVAFLGSDAVFGAYDTVLETQAGLSELLW